MKLKRGHFNNQGKIFSFKMQLTVVWRSLLEFDYVHLLEIDSDVESYSNCNFKLEFIYSEQKHYLSPNFIVKRNEKSYLTYLLPNNQKNPNQLSKLKFISDLCREKNYILQAITEEEIRQQPRLRNAKIIRKYAAKNLNDPFTRLLCYRLFKDKKEMLLNDVISFFVHNESSKRDVFRLIYQGILSININKPFDENALVTFAE